jgi:hypothetical protein
MSLIVRYKSELRERTRALELQIAKGALANILF